MAINEQINIDIKPFLDGLNKLAAAAKKVSGDVQTLLSKSGAIKLNVQADAKDLDKIEKQIDDISKNSEINVKVNASGNGNFLSGFSSQFKEAQAQAKAGGGIFGSLASQLGSFATPAGAATAAIGALTAGLTATFTIGREFETNLQAVSAVTGVTGDGLKLLGDNAKDLAGRFGGDASTQLKSFQGILSRFGADLAKTPEQLAAVSENINILAKAGGLDAAQAMDTLTNSMLQFGVDVANPNEAAQESARYINVLAASAKVGAAEIPQVGEAVLVAGVAAKQANVSFEETNAAIQVLAAGGKVGAEAGTALRNVLGKIAGEDVIPKDALNKLKSLGVDMNKVSDTSIPLSERLVELGKASKDATAFAQVFGTENAAAASILANGANTIKDWTAQITGTNEANKQAAINMATLSETISRVSANIQNVAIDIYQAIIPIVNNVIAAFSTLFDEVKPLLNDLFEQVKNVFGNIIDIVKPIFAVLAGVIASGWSVSVGLFTAAINVINKIVQRFRDFLAPIFEKIGSLFGGLGGEALTLSDVFEGFGKSIVLISDIFSGFVDVIFASIDLFTQVGKTIFQWVIAPFKLAVDIVGAIVNYIKEFVGGSKDATKESEKLGKETNKNVGFFTKLGEILLSIPNFFAGIVGAAEALGNILRDLGNVFTSVFENGIGGTFEKLKNIFSSAGENIGKGFNDGWNKKQKERIEADKKQAAENAKAQIDAQNKELEKAKPPKTDKDANKEKDDLLKKLSEQFAKEKEITDVKNAQNKVTLETLRISQGQTLSHEDKNDLAKKELENAENLAKKYAEIFKIVGDGVSEPIDVKAKLNKDEKLKVEKDYLTILQDINNKKLALNVSVEPAKDYKKVIDEINSQFEGTLSVEFAAKFGLEASQKEKDKFLEALNAQEGEINAKLAVTTDDKEKAALKGLIEQINKVRKDGDKNYLSFLEKYNEDKFNAELALIDDAAERELRIKIRNLLKQRDKELENTLLTEEGKKKIIERYNAEIAKLTDGNVRGFTTLINDSFTLIAKGLIETSKGATVEQKKQYEDAKKNLDEVNKKHQERIDAINGELAAIKQNTKDGGVLYNKNAEKILQLEEQKKNAILESNKEIEEANKRLEESSITTSKLIRNSFADSFSKIAELSQTQTNKAAENIGNLFASLKTDAEGNFTNLTETTDKVFAQLTTAAGASIATIGAGFGQLIAQGKANFGDFAKVAANAVLDAVQVMVNAYAAAIFGQNAAALPFGLGVPAALGLIATLNGLLAVAKASIGNIGAEDGVININKGYNKKKGITDTIPLWVAPNESIINAKSSIKYSNLLKAINGDGGSIVDGVLKSLNTKEIAALKNQLGSNTIQLNTERNIVQLPINTRQSNDDKQYQKLEKLLSNLNVKIDRNERTEISGKFDISGNNLTTVVNKIQKRKTRGF